ncbi:MAG TPA: hypothetical protein VF234_01360 [Limnochordia bacterium]
MGLLKAIIFTVGIVCLLRWVAAAWGWLAATPPGAPPRGGAAGANGGLPVRSLLDTWRRRWHESPAPPGLALVRRRLLGRAWFGPRLLWQRRRWW